MHHHHPSKNINLLMALTDKDRLRGKARATPQQSYTVAVSVPLTTIHARGSGQAHHPSPTSSQEYLDKSIAKGGVTTPFPWKLHEMLDDMTETNDHSVVCWQPHGRAFMVHNTKEFVIRIMPVYFNQTKYASFQRQLNLYGFARLSHGKDKGAYYHPCFVRGQRSLCRNMIRQKIKGTKVRRSLSVEEEPNFYEPQYHDKSRPSPVLHIPKELPAVLPANKPPTTRTRTKSISKRRTNNNTPTNDNKCESSKEGLPSPPLPIQSSLVSLMRESTLGAENTPPLPVLPSPPVLRQLCAIPPPMDFPSPTSTVHHHHLHHHGAVKGGDLLYFEGQPFRYLEHIDEIPSQPPAQSTLHDMISSIVNMEKHWPAAPRPTGQELYSR